MYAVGLTSNSTTNCFKSPVGFNNNNNKSKIRPRKCCTPKFMYVLKTKTKNKKTFKCPKMPAR